MLKTAFFLFLPLFAKATPFYGHIVSVFSNEWQQLLIKQNGAKDSFSPTDWLNFADTTTVLHLEIRQKKAEKTVDLREFPTDLSPIVKFPKLRKLYLNHNRRAKNLSTILAKATNLEVLELEDTNIKNLKFAKNLKKLNRLDIRQTAISNLEPLANLPNLRMILCIETKIPRKSILKISNLLPRECRIIRDYTL
ncbi:MAG: hypothetical protein RI894_1074 [Bacteroidota bacterium]|jgi:hypothetical protein